MSLYNVSLPPPSQELIAATVRKGATLSVDLSVYEMVKQSNPNINCAACIYFNSDEMYDLCKKEFGSYFDEEFFPTGIRMPNLDRNTTASYPPHYDGIRLTSLNFVIDSGGSNVLTKFYESTGSYDDLQGWMMPYEKEVPISETVFQKGIWYGLDVKRTHSVDNIETERVSIAWSFSNITIHDLVAKYPDLFTKVV